MREEWAPAAEEERMKGASSKGVGSLEANPVLRSPTSSLHFAASRVKRGTRMVRTNPSNIARL